MIRTWPGQTNEEWMKEVHRHIRLTPEEKKREFEEVYGTLQEREEKREQERLERIKGHEEKQKKYEEQIPYMDHPNTMDNGTATFFWVIIMIVAAIFQERWLIWIFVTGIYISHLTRHTREATRREIEKERGDK